MKQFFVAFLTFVGMLWCATAEAEFTISTKDVVVSTEERMFSVFETNRYYDANGKAVRELYTIKHRIPLDDDIIDAYENNADSLEVAFYYGSYDFTASHINHYMNGFVWCMQKIHYTYHVTYDAEQGFHVVKNTNKGPIQKSKAFVSAFVTVLIIFLLCLYFGHKEK